VSKFTAKAYRWLSVLMVLVVLLMPTSRMECASADVFGNLEYTTVSTVSTVENDLLFSERIAIAGDNTRASTYYMNVEVDGSSGKIAAEVWVSGNIPSHSLTVQLYRGTTSSNVSTLVGSVSTTNVGSASAPTKYTYSQTATYYYKVKVSGTIDGQSFSYSTNASLWNKKAVKYPSYTDAASGLSVSKPSSTIWSKVSSPVPALTTTQRNAYRSYYETTYLNGEAKDWTNIEIHHIRPRAYGGTHSYSNLIPLPKAMHNKFTSWWASY